MRALDMLEGMLQWLLRSSSGAGSSAEPDSTSQPADFLPDAAAREDPSADAESTACLHPLGVKQASPLRGLTGKVCMQGPAGQRGALPGRVRLGQRPEPGLWTLPRALYGVQQVMTDQPAAPAVIRSSSRWPRTWPRR